MLIEGGFMKNYQVIVGNIGTVHEGTNKIHALKIHSEYVKNSKANYGRASGEDVTTFQDGEPIKEYFGTHRYVGWFLPTCANKKGGV